MWTMTMTVQSPCFPVDFKEAYIADSESSSIRALDLKTGGSRLLAGGDPLFSENLFRVSPILCRQKYLVWTSEQRFSSGMCFYSRFWSDDVWFLQFGDLDGTGPDVLLQHPLGVIYAKDGQIYIADSYNHKVVEFLQKYEFFDFSKVTRRW